MFKSIISRAFRVLGSFFLMMGLFLLGLIFIIAPALAANLGYMLIRASE